MPKHQQWKRLVAAVAVLAAPALVFLTFDSIVAGGDPSVSRPALVETLGRASRAAGVAMRGSRERVRGADGAPQAVPEEPVAAPAPPSAPAAPSPVRVAVPILVYHNIKVPDAKARASDLSYYVTPEEFEAQMAYVESEGFSPVSAADIAAALRGTKALPPKPVFITFDDDRDSQFEHAFPSLRRHRLTATFYVFTNAIGRKGYLTMDQLRTLRDAGMSIESHSIFHPFLEKLDDAALRKEVADSKATLEKELGVTVDSFAYPFGTHQDRVVAAVREAGYSSARALRHSAAFGEADLFDLPGYVVTGDFAAFRQILSGARR